MLMTVEKCFKIGTYYSSQRSFSCELVLYLPSYEVNEELLRKKEATERYHYTRCYISHLDLKNQTHAKNDSECVNV